MAEESRKGLRDRDLLLRCHANTLEDYRTFARVTEGGAIDESPGTLFVNLGSEDSLENVAFFTEAPSDPVRALDRAASFFRDHRRPWSVLLFPSARRTLRPHLVDRRFRDEGKFPGMLLRRLPRRPPRGPNGLRVVRAASLVRLKDLQHAASRSYGIPYEAPDPRWLRAPGLSLYVGYWRGQPVVHGALIVAYGLAGVAYIGTVPEARRRDFAQALVGRILSDGRGQGCEAAYLWATPMGYGVYARMGFERILDYEIWSSPGNPLPPSIRGPSPGP